MASKAAQKNVTFIYEGTDRKGTKVKGEATGKAPSVVKAELRKQGINARKVVRKRDRVGPRAGAPQQRGQPRVGGCPSRVARVDPVGPAVPVGVDGRGAVRRRGVGDGRGRGGDAGGCGAAAAGEGSACGPEREARR